MKSKRILSSLLAVVILFSTVASLIPIKASAAYSVSSSAAQSDLSVDDVLNDSGKVKTKGIKTLVSETMNKISSGGYPTVESFIDEQKEHFLTLDYTSAEGKSYTLMIHKYLGFVYYVDNTTGQILESNPVVFPSGTDKVSIYETMSQLVIRYAETSGAANVTTYSSYQYAANYAGIQLQPIKNGVRVNYTIGDTDTRVLIPERITYDALVETIFTPLYEEFLSLLQTYCQEANPGVNFDYFTNPDYQPYDQYGRIDILNDFSFYYIDDAYDWYYTKWIKKNRVTIANDPELKAASKSIDDLYALFSFITASYASNEQDGLYYFYLPTSVHDSNKKRYAKVLKTFLPDYTLAQMFEQEEECGYTHEIKEKPLFRCAIEYAFDEDGTLMVRVPTNSIVFDETKYSVRSIGILPGFGAGNMSRDGYLFLPDGSGTIVEFEDFYSTNVNEVTENIALQFSIYGNDYCHASITGAHREQVTMPVFGMVNEVPASAATTALTGQTTVKNGFFTILEDAASHATLNVYSGGRTFSYMGAYASYAPYPIDNVSLNEVIDASSSTMSTLSSEGGGGTYAVIAESKYIGSYNSRIVMLTDSEIAANLNITDYYESSYIGMANCYRDYLYENGVLSAMEDVGDSLPLYIETIGAMDIEDQFLSFPITRTIPLTTFQDVYMLYEKFAENGVTNINFKLTGFANGGLNATYPTRVRWERACGGAKGFQNLVAQAETSGFGLYPEFDFQYIRNIALFDGISYRFSASRLIDNRFAYKRVFNVVSSGFSMRGGMIIAPEKLSGLYDKFLKRFGKYDLQSLSVSTLGSDLNSNFDERATVDRHDAQGYVEALLNRMTNVDGYDLMVETGNIYALKYAKHILRASLDSSHFNNSSYPIPFTGMILHGAVNYAGAPLNYSGTPEYDLLRAIENGASLYYILCCQNIAYMKEYRYTSQYYSVDYANWCDDIIATYNVLNGAIGDLQNHKIVSHAALIGERVVRESEEKDMYEQLKNEYLQIIRTQLQAKIDAVFASLREDPENYGRGVDITIDVAALKDQFVSDVKLASSTLSIGFQETIAASFADDLQTLVDEFKATYDGSKSSNAVPITYDTLEDYKANTAYNYLTDSESDDKDYEKTVYTCDNGNIVTVKYSYTDPQTGETSNVMFLLNYNVFAVNVKLNGQTYTLQKYEFLRLNCN